MSAECQNRIGIGVLLLYNIALYYIDKHNAVRLVQWYYIYIPISCLKVYVRYSVLSIRYSFVCQSEAGEHGEPSAYTQEAAELV
jgi:hypothetical protein